MNMNKSMMFAASVALCAANLVAAPFFVDISGVANCSRTDDGIAGNGEGGWSDEGINDMETYPPVPVGAQHKNNYHFFFIDPKTSGGKDVIRLKGREGESIAVTDRVEVPVPSKKAKFIYFFQNEVMDSGCDPAKGPAAVYTVKYADGSSVDFPQSVGVHLQPWWAFYWWQNHEQDAWPVHMSRNIYSMKWGKFIAIFGTRCDNPHPEKEITSIVLQSKVANASPVIWGITLDDEDYFGPREDKSKREGEVWGNPPKVPDGYYDAKMAGENKLKYEEALKLGFVTGIRSVNVIKPDLIAVTVDAALTGSTRPSVEQVTAELAKKPFAITSKDDPAYKSAVVPEKLGRFTYEDWNGDIGKFRGELILAHTIYIPLVKPLVEGKAYTITAAKLADGMKKSIDLVYDMTAVNPAFKFNQASYFPNSKQRWAYLGWWAGDLGTVDYSMYKTFEVYDADGKAKVADGELVFRIDNEKNKTKDPSKNRCRQFTGEDIYEMDLSALGVGSYRIRIPGLGWSEVFSVGDKEKFRKLYYDVNRAFLHQRCGQELKAPWSKVNRPACHVWTDVKGRVYNDANAPADKTGLKRATGGYHDAGDDDCFTYHLRATQVVMDAWEMFPDAFKDGDLNLPESGNGIPDVLDEAHWALSWYRDTQYADGGVHKGKCNQCDSARQGHLKWDDYGWFKPDRFSNLEYAAVAATFARHYAKYDAKEAATFAESAKKAYDWACRQPGEWDKAARAGGVWAASELYFTTKDENYLAAVKRHAGNVDCKNTWGDLPFGAYPLHCVIWHYALSEDPKLDQALRQRFRAEYDKKKWPAVEIDGPYRAGLWFDWAGGNAGGFRAEPMIRAWYLLGREQKYLDYVSLCADFQLGCNAISRTFVTGQGYRPPRHPQISPALYPEPYLRGEPTPGFVVFGLSTGRGHASSNGYPRGEDIPAQRRYVDMGGGTAEYNSEFTINETIGVNAMLYAFLWSQVQ